MCLRHRALLPPTQPARPSRGADQAAERSPRVVSGLAAVALLLLVLAFAGRDVAPALAQGSSPLATAEPRYPPTPEPKDVDEDEEDEEEPSPPQAPSATPRPGFVLPARTQRPTRTPRATALPSPTPLAAGGLRLSFTASPAVLILRERATFALELVNQGDQEVGGLVIDVVAPDVLIDFEAQASAGSTSRAGGLIAWHVGRFGPGERAGLSLQGRVARAGAGRTAICATLISSGAAIEHCAGYPVQAAAAVPEATAPGPVDEAAIPEAPAGPEALRQSLRPGLLAGFGLLLVGLFGLAYSWARQPRGPAAAGAQMPDDPARHGSERDGEPTPPRPAADGDRTPARGRSGRGKPRKAKP